MPKTTLEQLADYGQSIWLDYINRPLMRKGQLKELVDSGLRGMTSNPSIFNEVISNMPDYDEDIVHLSEKGKTTFEIYDELTTGDVREAADIFKGVYEKTNGLDGYVSLEINPQLAAKAKESIEEGVRLYQKVNRPNIMIKVPATQAGFPVIEELLSRGINVNVTLIFSVEQYRQTAKSFLRGMAKALRNKKDLEKIHSVASVFVSRIDTSVDKLLDEKKLPQFKGKAAVANCEIIFGEFFEIFSSPEFKMLAQMACPPQRVLWASTGTKNPEYSDVKYVTELIAKPTVNTLPEKTLQAFLDHGIVREAITVQNKREAQKNIATLTASNIDVNETCEKLLTDGVAAFEKSFESLLNAIENKARSLCAK